MIKRTIEISGQDLHLRIEQGWLRICRRDEPQPVGAVPLDDLGVLILDSPSTTYSHAVLSQVLLAGAAIIPCGPNHLPCGAWLPQNHTLQTQRMAAQAAAPLPLRKQLWKQLVQSKLVNQANVLPPEHHARGRLLSLPAEVRSGDPANVEAQGAKLYWAVLFEGFDFHRDPDGEAPNNLLNYGYAVVRAAVARAICGAGLHPSLGLQHSNRNNPFCLADDLMEPLRPMVDRSVLSLVRAGKKELDRAAKENLLSLLTADIEVGDARSPLMVGLARIASSLVDCYEGASRRLELPRLCD